MAIEKGSMREVINNVYQILINDEELLRLLWYLPKNKTKVDPLDSSLTNIKEMDNYWDIIEDRIMLTGKVSDLVEKSICRLYITSGRRRANGTNYLMANQQILINVYVHEDYEDDMRLEWIADRLSLLLALEHIDGSIGMLNFVKSDPAEAPTQYQRFVHTYEFNTMKK